MVRKHRRRTRKRNKRGGSVMDKMKAGILGLDNLRKQGQQGVMDAAKVTGESLEHVKRGYRGRVEQGGVLPQPPSSYLNPETGIVTESTLSMDPIKENPLPPLQMGETNQPSKEIKGGLLGLGTWFGLGGRRLSHSAFINKMLRVRNKTKRNKAIRKYLKGGKKKTRRRKTKRRGGMNPQGGDNNLPRQAQQAQQIQTAEEREAARLTAVQRQVDTIHRRRIDAARKARRDALIKEGNSGRGLGGGKRKRKNKTKKRRRRR